MIDKVHSIEEGVAKLLKTRLFEIPEYTLLRRTAEEYTDTLVWDGKKIPLYETRYDCRLNNMADYGKEADKNSALNVYSYTGIDVTLDQLIYRELEIAEYLLHSRIEKITAFVNGNAANLIALMENGTCANIDVGTTMAPGSENQCQHRLITTHGMTNDRAVGTMTVANQVSVFGCDSKAPVVFDDDEYYLYGLDDDEVSKALTIYFILTGAEDYSDWNERDARYRAAIKAVYASNEQLRPVFIKEVL